MSRLLLTGSTGFLGSYIAAQLLLHHGTPLSLLVRARTEREAQERLWQSLQLHMDFETFRHVVSERVEIYLGDITKPSLGLSDERLKKLIAGTESVIHCAAALNRRSQEACTNVNLRGTLEVVKIAQAIHEHHGLRRFSNISTVAVAGRRNHETVTEDRAIGWLAPDSDPYGQTKKFAEHMARRLLPEELVTTFRPSAIIGDTRFPKTTQFDMIKAFDLFAKAPIIPLDPQWRIDIVPADYVGRSIVTIHQKKNPAHSIYHVSAGEASLNYRQILKCLDDNGDKDFAPRLFDLTKRVCARLAKTPPRWGLAYPAVLVQVFLDHLRSDTVFDNRRIVEETGEVPAPFSQYAGGLLHYARQNAFQSASQPWPQTSEEPRRSTHAA